jgi:hypothetical protein
MQTIKRLVFALAATAALLVVAAPGAASAHPWVLSTEFNANVDDGETITGLYQNFMMPKFPDTPGYGAASQHFQIQYIDGPEYNFVYFQVDKVCRIHIGGCVWSYQVEVSYQIHDSSQFHDGFLSDYALPGDSIDFVYYETGGDGAFARILNTPAAGHTGFDHSGTWTWSGTHPREYQEPHFAFTVTPDGTGHNCAGDLPQQDVPFGFTHIGTLNYLGIVTLADTSQISAALHVIDPPVTAVTPTSCSIAVTTGTYGPYTTYTLQWYGGL